MKPFNLTLTLVVSILILLHFSSCLNDKVDDLHSANCDSTYFVTSIRPIFVARCYNPDGSGGCHNGTSTDRGDYSVYDAAQNGIQAKLSTMSHRLNLPLNDPDHMPQGYLLSSAELTTLNEWLDAGARYCK